MASTRTTRVIEQAKQRSGYHLGGSSSVVNVGDAERWASTIAGGALALYGVKQGTWGGLALATVGCGLICRGVSGHCRAYQVLGIDTADRGPAVGVPAQVGVKVTEAITVNRPAAELYFFWRDFENLPRFMDHLASVRKLDDKRSHWVAKAPLGTTVEWDAEIINERPNEMIAWRSIPGSEVDTAGSVHFDRATGGRGTQVRVELKYNPLGGMVGATIAKLFGEAPEQQIQEDLRRFKQVMEAGEAATIAGQPSGRS